jgi:hypothetical protein
MKSAKPSSRTFKPLDATIRFQFCGPQSVEILEILGGHIRERSTVAAADAVSEVENKYIFYGEEAELARDLIRMGKPCSFNVYKREP